MGLFICFQKKSPQRCSNPPLKKCRHWSSGRGPYVSRCRTETKTSRKHQRDKVWIVIHGSTPNSRLNLIRLVFGVSVQKPKTQKTPMWFFVVFCSEFRQRHRVSPGYIFQDVGYNICSSWWFQPLWKILVKLDHVPKLGMKIKKYFKPPPRCCLFCCVFRSRV